MFRPVYCAIVSHYTRDHAFNTDIPHTALRRVMPTADFSSCSAANNASLILAKTLAFLVVPSSWLCMAPSAQIDNIAVTFSSLQVGLFSVVLEPISRVLDISITIRVSYCTKYTRISLGHLQQVKGYLLHVLSILMQFWCFLIIVNLAFLVSGLRPRLLNCTINKPNWKVKRKRNCLFVVRDAITTVWRCHACAHSAVTLHRSISTQRRSHYGFQHVSDFSTRVESSQPTSRAGLVSTRVERSTRVSAVLKCCSVKRSV